jgi:hypothetical protein
VADRPGDLSGGQPSGLRLGTPGPDQGYALRLVKRLRPRVHLGPLDHFEDVAAGLVAVGLKRAASYGRAPILADLEVAAASFGFFDDTAARSVVEPRSHAFAGVASPHHYEKLRELADSVATESLRCSPSEAAQRYDQRANP